MNWNEELDQRINNYSHNHKIREGEEAISIKIRAEEGCFHKSCCPYALKMIYQKMNEMDQEEFEYIEHESGPEIIAYISLTASGLLLVKSIIELITTIIKARFDGQKHGDGHKGSPVTLIIRKTKKGKVVIEEKIMTFSESDEVSNDIINTLISDGYKRLKLKENGNITTKKKET